MGGARRRGRGGGPGGGGGAPGSRRPRAAWTAGGGSSRRTARISHRATKRAGGNAQRVTRKGCGVWSLSGDGVKVLRVIGGARSVPPAGWWAAGPPVIESREVPGRMSDCSSSYKKERPDAHFLNAIYPTVRIAGLSLKPLLRAGLPVRNVLCCKVLLPGMQPNGATTPVVIADVARASEQGGCDPVYFHSRRAQEEKRRNPL